MRWSHHEEPNVETSHRGVSCIMLWDENALGRKTNERCLNATSLLSYANGFIRLFKVESIYNRPKAGIRVPWPRRGPYHARRARDGAPACDRGALHIDGTSVPAQMNARCRDRCRASAAVMFIVHISARYLLQEGS